MKKTCVSCIHWKVDNDTDPNGTYGSCYTVKDFVRLYSGSKACKKYEKK